MKYFVLFLLVILFLYSCQNEPSKQKMITAAEILGNKEFQTICFGGFREETREICPTVQELKEDMKIISAMGIKVIRTYSTQLYPHAERTLKAISELKKEDSSFEMYAMLGAWIQCEGGFTETRDHEKGDTKLNEAEIKRAIELANEYPDIVKILAVGNEAMVHWAETYYVAPKIILQYIQQLQDLKKQGGLDSNLWITSSDNFASWGGESADYHNKDLKSIYEAVDYISMHTYPFHDSHYNSGYWLSDISDTNLNQVELAKIGMQKAADYAQNQYKSVKNYMESIGINKPVHLGETGWSTSSHGIYGNNGSNAAGEYKQKLYYDAMRAWSNEEGLSCFIFEAFDEPWKDTNDVRASENHFGLIDIEGRAKYVLWDLVDLKSFEGLTRNGKAITKTFDGQIDSVFHRVFAPPYTYSTNH